MIADDVEGFLKFLDKVSLQLASLLDLDGQQRYLRKSQTRQKLSLISKTRSSRFKSADSSGDKRKQQKLQQPTRAKGRRKNRQQDSTELVSSISDQSNKISHQDHLSADNRSHHQHHYEVSRSKIDQLTGSQPDTLEGHLNLAIVDEALNLDHGTSISPTPHLSPMDPTIQFHPQHYYGHSRGHLDSYQLQDEFTTSHEPIPISSSSAGQLLASQEQQSQQPQQQQQPSQSTPIQSVNMSSQAQLPTIRGESILDARESLNNNSDCFQVHQIHSTQHQHSHHMQHQLQYHQLDQQQWLGSASHLADNTIALASTDSSTIEHVPLSPAAHQSLDQVQFNTPLYHHNYYNHPVDQLDSFHQMNEDFATPTSSASISASSTSPINPLLRTQHQQQEQQRQQAQQDQGHQQQIRMSLSNGNQVVAHTDYDQSSQQLHHHHHQQVQIAPEHNQMHNMTLNYNTHHQHSNQHQHQHSHQHQHQHSHHNHHHHQQQQQSHHQHQSHHNSNNNNHQQQHHHHHHHMIPLMNGLDSGVIIQDINLASASWSPPEDLYSI